MLVAQSCPTLCDPTDYSPLGSSVHGILQARVLEWVAVSFSRGSSRPRDRIRVSCLASRFFTLYGTLQVFLCFPQKFKMSCRIHLIHCGDPGFLSANSLGILDLWLYRWKDLRSTIFGEENGNPLQYSGLENPMDRGDWWTTVHGVSKSRTWLSN